MADKSRMIFVGNIPYEATEQSLKEHFSEVGEVINFRIVLDRESGKPKGFGFCEFKDSATAASALRNLNYSTFCGRQLRLDTAVDKDMRANDPSLQQARPAGGPAVGSMHPSFNNPPPPQVNAFRPPAPQQQQYQQHYQQQQLPPPAFAGPVFDPSLAYPPPLQYGPAVPAHEAEAKIAAVIDSIEPLELYGIMTTMKHVATTQPDQVRALLTEQPQLCLAMLRAQLRMHMIEPELAQQMLLEAASRPGPAFQQPLPPQPQQAQPRGPWYAPQEQRLAAPPPPSHVDRSRPEFAQPPYYAPPLPQQSYPGYDPRQQQQQPPSHHMPLQTYPPHPVAAAGIPQEEMEMVMKVLQLTDQQLMELPPNERHMVMELKRKFLAQQ